MIDVDGTEFFLGKGERQEVLHDRSKGALRYLGRYASLLELDLYSTIQV